MPIYRWTATQHTFRRYHITRYNECPPKWYTSKQDKAAQAKEVRPLSATLRLKKKWKSDVHTVEILWLRKSCPPQRWSYTKRQVRKWATTYSQCPPLRSVERIALHPTTKSRPQTATLCPSGINFYFAFSLPKKILMRLFLYCQVWTSLSTECPFQKIFRDTGSQEQPRSLPRLVIAAKATPRQT